MDSWRRRKLFVEIVSWVGFILFISGAICFPAWIRWRDLKHLWLIPSGVLLVIGGVALVARAAKIPLGLGGATPRHEGRTR